MIHFTRIGLVCLALTAAIGLPRAAAQLPYGDRSTNPNAGPAVSPYLNLMRRGTSAGVNYYGLVRPELEFRNAFRGLQQELDAQRGEQGDARTGMPATGHATSFLDTRGYFLNVAPVQRHGPPGLPGGPAMGSPPGAPAAGVGGRR